MIVGNNDPKALLGPRWRFVLPVACVVGVVALDLITKAVAVEQLDVRTDLPLGFGLALSTNEGIAFGAFSSAPTALILAVGLVLSFLLIFAVNRFALPWLPVALLIGGAFANLADRLGDGAVTDFIDPPRWPSFNLADVAITLGALGLVLASVAQGPAPPTKIEPRGEEPATSA
jgi:signal peptidase II